MKKNRNDMILVLSLLLIAVISYLVLFMVNTAAPTYALVTIDGREEVKLRLDEDSEYIVSCDEGKNTINVKEGRVSVTEADCPDELCKKQGYISKTGETIVCLPHKVVVTICGDEGQEIDAVVK